MMKKSGNFQEKLVYFRIKLPTYIKHEKRMLQMV